MTNSPHHHQRPPTTGTQSNYSSNRDSLNSPCEGELAHNRWSQLTLTRRAPRLLIGVEEEILDGAGQRIRQRYSFVTVDESGRPSESGPAPYLDYARPDDDHVAGVGRELRWLGDAEESAVAWAVVQSTPSFVDEVAQRGVVEIGRKLDAVQARLESEINRLTWEAMQADQLVAQGKTPKLTSTVLNRHADELQARLGRRLRDGALELEVRGALPQIRMIALVLPTPRDEQTDHHAVET